MSLAWKKYALAAIVFGFGIGTAGGQSTPDALKKGFENPPSSARPRVWWHWMNGNITEEGIKADLEWMHRVGLAGYQNFDAALQTPQVVDKRLAYMTPEWKKAFLYATKLTDQLGMEEAIAGSPGWSESGGPWVPAAQGMKKYVWSETQMKGGQPFHGVLPHPPSNTGAFQNMGIHEQFGGEAENPPRFYADAAVIAYRRTAADAPMDAGQVKITSSSEGLDAAMLSDGDLEKSTKVPIAAVGEISWVQYEFPAAQTIRAITYAMRDPNFIEAMMTGRPQRNLEASDDGQSWRPLHRSATGEGAAVSCYTWL